MYVDPNPSMPARKIALVVEDDPELRSGVVSLLAHEGFHPVATASTEFDALQWLAGHEGEWHLVVADLLLHEGSGFNVLYHAKKAMNPGKVVVYSGYVTDAIRMKCEQFGADAVILKPDIGQLLNILEAFRPRDA